MVAMAVGDEDMSDLLAFDRRGDSLEMRLVGAAGIDDRDLACSDHIGIGAEKSVRAGIVGDDAADAGRDLYGHAIIDIHAPIERKLRRHGLNAALVFSRNLGSF